MSVLRHLVLPRAPPLLLPSARLYTTWRESLQEKWASEDEIKLARSWLATFQQSDIPRKQCQVSFSQASGPGGQNVNKLSTKATLHLSLQHAAQFLPEIVIRKIKENARHLTVKDEIVVQSDKTRKQSENTEDVFHRLFNIIVASVKHDLPGETSPEKHQRVLELQKKERAHRMEIKNKQKSKKDSRRRGGGRGDLG